MLIAHLPAGYLCTRFFLNRAKMQVPAIDRQRYLRIGMIASILPDFDVTYYYLCHYLNGQWGAKHHTYWSHTPFYWLMIRTRADLSGRPEGARMRSAVFSERST